MCSTWVATVRRLTQSPVAISALFRPEHSSRSTSSSRADNDVPIRKYCAATSGMRRNTGSVSQCRTSFGWAIANWKLGSSGM